VQPGLCYDLQNDNKNCGACGNAVSHRPGLRQRQVRARLPYWSDQLQRLVRISRPSRIAAPAERRVAQRGVQHRAVCDRLQDAAQPGIADTWGFSWDGLERAAATFSQAQTTCEGIGGRLPTASELYRVSATQSANVGQTIHTNWLWSLVPYATDTHMSVRLSDAATTNQADASALNYRCVCPPPLPNAYVGNNCFGKPGQGCYALGGEGSKYNLDAQDRAPLSKGSAIWECAFHRGRLPRPSDTPGDPPGRRHRQ
jgi:hypothetical protein